jgi:DNA-binding MarR family transcriptional regulator
MHLLDELSRTPEVTQRELSQRIGVALGLINLMLRRLTKKGYIKIRGTKRSRIRYLITPKGILEKSRLTYEFIQYSLQLYGRVRGVLREQLTQVAKAGHRRILLYGTGELAEIAFLTVQEMGLTLVGIVEDPPERAAFLGQAVRNVSEVEVASYDRVVVASMRWEDGGAAHVAAFGVPPERIIILPRSGFPHATSAEASLLQMTPILEQEPVAT